ncbi:hypothetical protein C8Q80DRAFT_912101 [Daedaleopsis nitida]|nr:hypothetical protein C8Q80DRAFT_912101 [Daedaleopsis nitida]
MFEDQFRLELAPYARRPLAWRSPAFRALPRTAGRRTGSWPRLGPSCGAGTGASPSLQASAFRRSRGCVRRGTSGRAVLPCGDGDDRSSREAIWCFGGVLPFSGGICWIMSDLHEARKSATAASVADINAGPLGSCPRVSSVVAIREHRGTSSYPARLTDIWRWGWNVRMALGYVRLCIPCNVHVDPLHRCH